MTRVFRALKIGDRVSGEFVHMPEDRVDAYDDYSLDSW